MALAATSTDTLRQRALAAHAAALRECEEAHREAELRRIERDTTLLNRLLTQWGVLTDGETVTSATPVLDGIGFCLEWRAASPHVRVGIPCTRCSAWQPGPETGWLIDSLQLLGKVLSEVADGSLTCLCAQCRERERGQ